MKSLEQYSFGSTRGQKAKHEWAKILDGGIYECVQGDDFDCSIVTFSALARTRAASMGKGIRVAQNAEKRTVVVQAYDLPPEEGQKARQRVIDSRRKWAEGRKAKLAAEANGHANGVSNSVSAPPTATDAPAPVPAAKPVQKPVQKPQTAGARK